MILDEVFTTKYNSFKLKEFKKPPKNHPNIKYFIEISTEKQQFIIRTVKNFYSANRTRLFKTN